MLVTPTAELQNGLCSPSIKPHYNIASELLIIIIDFVVTFFGCRVVLVNTTVQMSLL